MWHEQTFSRWLFLCFQDMHRDGWEQCDQVVWAKYCPIVLSKPKIVLCRSPKMYHFELVKSGPKLLAQSVLALSLIAQLYHNFSTSVIENEVGRLASLWPQRNRTLILCSIETTVTQLDINLPQLLILAAQREDSFGSIKWNYNMEV